MPAKCSSSALSLRSRSFKRPYFNSAARSKLTSLSALSISMRHSSISFLIFCTRAMDCFSACQPACMASDSLCRSCSSFNRLLSLSWEALSFSFFKAAASISSCIIRRVISSSSAGMLSISVRSLAAASSTRSIALSGKNLSEI